MPKRLARPFEGASAFCALALALVAQPSLRADEAPIILGQGEVRPFAVLEFIDAPSLSAAVLSAGPATPAETVRFRAIGNTIVSVTAEPDAFVSIPGVGMIGKAIHEGNEIGYKVRVTFPIEGQGVPEGSRQLSGNGEGTAPLYGDLMFAGGSLVGTVDLVSDHQWTPDGGLPPAGTYHGMVNLTISVY